MRIFNKKILPKRFPIVLIIITYIGWLPKYSFGQSSQTPTKHEHRLEKRSLRRSQRQQRAYEKSLEKRLNTLDAAPSQM